MGREEAVSFFHRPRWVAVEDHPSCAIRLSFFQAHPVRTGSGGLKAQASSVEHGPQPLGLCGMASCCCYPCCPWGPALPWAGPSQTP